MSNIRGKIQKGLGESRNTVKEQMPFFSQCFPEVMDCFYGTINVLLEKPIVILSPDYETDPLPWHPAFKVVKGGEVFRFLRINLTVDGCEPCRAWIYKAQFSPYYIEILAPKLNFSGTPNCSIEVCSPYSEGIIVGGKS